jgi:hypothetical protein
MLWPTYDWYTFFKKQSEAVSQPLELPKPQRPNQPQRKYPLSGPNSPKR